MIELIQEYYPPVAAMIAVFFLLWGVRISDRFFDRKIAESKAEQAERDAAFEQKTRDCADPNMSAIEYLIKYAEPGSKYYEYKP